MRWASLISLSLPVTAWLGNVVNVGAASPWFSLPPELRIARASGAVAVSWPTWAFTYQLEASDAVSDSTMWRNTAASLRVVEDKIVATIEPTSSRQFFRLSGTTCIPLFQFAIFYNGDMEFNGAPTLYVRGPVHGNANIYTGSAADRYFYNDVTAAGIISDEIRYSWTNTGEVFYFGSASTNAPRLALPFDTSTSPEAVREILQPPPPDEPIDSPMGRERYYNKAEMIIQVTDTNVFVGVKQAYTSSLVNIDWLAATNFVSTNKTFTDQREGKIVLTTEIDVGKFVVWASTNSTVVATLGANEFPNILYVKDARTGSETKMAGVRLVNGRTLPSHGLTVATPNPLYTKGHYNQPNDAYLGTTNTSSTKPASLICDAYTLLSQNFMDSASSGSFTNRHPSSTTVVAAIVTGNVTQTPGYSGGVADLPRLLEAWNGKVYTLNGSLVCLFTSVIATNSFQDPGAYYSAPIRNINFDPNFLDIYRLPPGTPFVRVVVPSE